MFSLQLTTKSMWHWASACADLLFRSRSLARLLVVLATTTLQAAAPIPVLLLTGQADLPHHNWRETTAAIRALFHNDPRFDLRVIEDATALTPETLRAYQAVIVNYNGPRLAAPAEQALEAFVQNGGGLAAFHHAAYGEWFGMQLRDGKWTAGPTQGWAAFTKMIGASWQPANIGHARRWPFPIHQTGKAHPITQDLPPQWMANDELYHRLDLAPTVHVIADALSPKEIGGTGRREPLAWTNTFGRGRVFFTPLGHDATAWHQPGMRQLFLRAVEWTATGRVTPSLPGPELKLLVVTGGHSYPTAFYAMLDSLEGVRWTHATNHAEAFARPITGRYDVILFHDLYNASTEQTRERLREFVDNGNGVVSLHHAIVDYTDWPWWYQEVTGGKYFEKPVAGHSASAYKEGVDFLVSAVKGKQNHPVLRGVGPLFVHDELYKNMWFSPRIEVLMETEAPDNDRPVVYIGPHPKARSIYIQLGHSAQTMQNPGFRRLVRNALYWAARKEVQP